MSDRSQVLVVDDGPHLRDPLATVLRFHGFEVCRRLCPDGLVPGVVSLARSR